MQGLRCNTLILQMLLACIVETYGGQGSGPKTKYCIVYGVNVSQRNGSNQGAYMGSRFVLQFSL